MLRRCLGMDIESIRTLSRDEAGEGCTGRIQREVHVQSAGASRRLVRDTRVAHPADLPKLLPPRGSLAVQRNPTSEELMTQLPTTIGHHHETTAGRNAFRRDVIHGLSRPRKAIPCKYFYDDRGSALFDEICDLDEYYLTR